LRIIPSAIYQSKESFEEAVDPVKGLAGHEIYNVTKGEK